MKFDGIEEFLARRQRSKNKALQTGAMTDLSLFGLK
jgi:hypothetical protein